MNRASLFLLVKSMLVLAALTMVSVISLSEVRANDASFGGTASDLVPLEEKRVRMVSEDILLDYMVVPKVGHQWKIAATYTFENTTDKDVKLTFGFPEQFCDPESDCNSPDNKHTFRNFKTTVAGKPVKLRVGKVAEKNAWAPELGRVHLFEATVPASKSIEVVHRYDMGVSMGSMGMIFFTYITKTGALWAGPIGSARFTIRTPFRPWSVGHSATFVMSRYDSTIVDKKPVTELVFEMKDWTPSQDLDINLGAPMDNSMECPMDPFYMWSDVELRKAGLAEAKALFGDLDDAKLRFCRNLPYAHQGYTFKDAKLSTEFYEASRLSTSVEFDNDEEGAPKAYSRFRFRPNPHFTPALFSPAHGVYVKLAKLLEQERKAASKAGPAGKTGAAEGK